MLLPPSAQTTDFPAIGQVAEYTLNTTAFPAIRVTAVNFSNGLSATSQVQPTIGAAGYAGDTTLGQLVGIGVLAPLGVTIPMGQGAQDIDTQGLEPLVKLTHTTVSGIGNAVAGYALPSSATLNPIGFTYQTYGGWASVVLVTTLRDGYFSTGVPTTAAMPVTGTASYSGRVVGTFINATSGEPSDLRATVSVQVDFATRAITVSTASSGIVSVDAPDGTAPTGFPGLNLQGTFTYSLGNNTFSGAVSSANGMTGNVTGRFYGPPIGAGTATKSAGSPPEIGGTFAVLLPGSGSIHGSFGAQ